jgi:hypothetical protein
MEDEIGGRKSRNAARRRRNSSAEPRPHLQLSSLLILMILSSFSLNFFASYDFRPLIISFLLFTFCSVSSRSPHSAPKESGKKESRKGEQEEDLVRVVLSRLSHRTKYLQWRVADWSECRCLGDVGRKMLQLRHRLLIGLQRVEDENKRAENYGCCTKP